MKCSTRAGRIGPPARRSALRTLRLFRTKVLEVCQELKQRYARIFTRELAPIWYGSRRR